MRPGPWARRLRSACAEPLVAFRDAIEEDAIVPWWPLVVACVVGSVAAAQSDARLELIAPLALLGAPALVILLALASTSTWLTGRIFGVRAPWRHVFRAHVWGLVPAAAASIVALVIVILRAHVQDSWHDEDQSNVLVLGVALSLASLVPLLQQAWQCSFGLALLCLLASVGVLAGAAYCVAALEAWLSDILFCAMILVLGGVLVATSRADRRRRAER